MNFKISTMKLLLLACLLDFLLQMLKIESLQQFHLLVSADARAAGMGDMGCQHQLMFFPTMESAKCLQLTNKASISYTPYLTDLANDISLRANYLLQYRTVHCRKSTLFWFW
jgi:hypothetical protein